MAATRKPGVASKTAAPRKYRRSKTKVEIGEAPGPLARGRKTDYRPEYVEHARRLTLLGLTVTQLAHFFECDRDTIFEWQRRHPKFNAAIRDSREAADGVVAYSLYQRAIGMVLTQDRLSPRGDVVQVREQLPPDVSAALGWLRSRQSTLWQDKSVRQLQGPDEGPVQVVTGLDPETERKLAALQAKFNAFTAAG